MKYQRKCKFRFCGKEFATNRSNKFYCDYDCQRRESLERYKDTTTDVLQQRMEENFQRGRQQGIAETQQKIDEAFKRGYETGKRDGLKAAQPKGFSMLGGRLALPPDKNAPTHKVELVSSPYVRSSLGYRSDEKE